MLSVLQVTPELNAGGVERTTLEIAQAISRAGGLALVASAGGRLEPDLEAAGGELIRLPVHTKNPLVAAANTVRLRDLIRARGVTIVHARSRAPAWSALVAARQAGVAFVTTYHGIYNGRTPLKRFYNSVMARGQVVIANSDYTRTHVLERYRVAPERVVTIPRGVDIEVFDRARLAAPAVAAMRAGWGLAPDDTRCVLIAPARLTRWKGQLALVEAVKLVEQRKPGTTKVILAGDAQGRIGYVREIQAAIAAARLQDAVAIVGHISDMATAFAAADVSVFPVLEPEAFGRGAIEAQAMGVPVVASAIGGFTETVIDGESGFLVQASQARALAEAIERMIDLGPNARAAMGESGRQRVRALYSTASLQSATLAVYQRVLHESEQVRAARGQP